MRTSHKVAVVGMAIAPMAVITAGIAFADQPPAPPAPTTPAYICDAIVANDPAYFGVTNCQPFGGIQATGFLGDGSSYKLIPRTGDPAGNVQSFNCSGGYADTPSTISPKKCSPIGAPVKASVAPSAIPFTPAYAVPAAPPAPPKK
jgi:hypothetical protein